jgi:hypothetical protein
VGEQPVDAYGKSGRRPASTRLEEHLVVIVPRRDAPRLGPRAVDASAKPSTTLTPTPNSANA